MCLLNNTAIDTIPQDFIWGMNVWHPEHPLFERLIDHLFHFTEVHNGYDGTISSETEPFVDMDGSLNTDGRPDTD